MQVRTVEELEAFAQRFAAGLVPRPSGAVVVTLSGDLGAGKTTFAQFFAKALGVEEGVTSPTFVIEKIYDLPVKKNTLTEVRLPSPAFRRLIHIDAYRLENPHQLEVLGFKELLEHPGNVILLEWPERVAELIPKDAVKIRFDIHGDERTISVNDGA